MKTYLEVRTREVTLKTRDGKEVCVLSIPDYSETPDFIVFKNTLYQAKGYLFNTYQECLAVHNASETEVVHDAADDFDSLPSTLDRQPVGQEY